MSTAKVSRFAGGRASRVLVSAASAGVATSLGPAVARGQAIYEVPMPPGATSATVNDVSADGTTIVGWGSVSPQIKIPFRWRIGQAIEVLPGLPGSTSESAYAVSADGAYCTGDSGWSGVGGRAVRWGPDGIPQDLGVPAHSAVGAAINGDGTVIAGDAFINTSYGHRAFLWTQSIGTELFGYFGPNSAFVADMTPDGSTFAGHVQGGFPGYLRYQLTWTRQAGVQVSGSPSRVTALTQMGHAICTTGDSNLPSIWTIVDGQSYNLANSYKCYPSGANANGTVIAAYSLNLNKPAFWTAEQQGAQDAAAYFAARGVDLTGWTLTSVRSMNADAHVIAGTGVHNGLNREFVVTMPCLDSVQVVLHPTGVSRCDGSTSDHTSLLAYGTGSGYVAYQWRKNGVPLHDGAGAAGGTGIVTRSNSSAMTIYHGPSGRPSPGDSGEYDCVLTVGCVSVTTEPATIQNCITDFNCDLFVNGIDFDDYVVAFEAGTDPRADVNFDGFINGIDFDVFMDAFVAGC